jgi:acidic leucine-rich nuclear phosphoprotein 32 family protein A/C/D
LSLNGFGLKNIKSFPKIPTLKSLELRQNHITGDLADLKSLYPELRKLKLGENPIKSLDALKSLVK